MTRNRTVGIAALAVVILAAIIAGGIAMRRGATTPATASPMDAAPLAIARVAIPPASQPTTRTASSLRVGVYLSKMTGAEWGYSCQITGDLVNKGMTVLPLLEPGSAAEPEVKKLLGVYFRGQQPIDVTHADDLSTLDVIVAPRIWLLPDDARDAIETAVRAGTGLLLRDGLGCMSPGGGPAVSRLSGFDASAFGYNAHPMDCQVIADHPLLGTLANGTTVTITPNGTWGVPGAKTLPLICVKDMAKFHDFYHHGGADWIFYPLYVAELGKGRIVGCQWPAWERMPKDLQAATDAQFNLRAVKWLAHKQPNTN